MCTDRKELVAPIHSSCVGLTSINISGLMAAGVGLNATLNGPVSGFTTISWPKRSLILVGSKENGSYNTLRKLERTKN